MAQLEVDLICNKDKLSINSAKRQIRMMIKKSFPQTIRISLKETENGILLLKIRDNKDKLSINSAEQQIRITIKKSFQHFIRISLKEKENGILLKIRENKDKLSINSTKSIT
mgnify:CR=1 FL=1